MEAHDYQPSVQPLKMERILNAVTQVWVPGQVRELRVLGSGRGVVSGFYDDPEALARDAALWDRRGSGANIYWTINPINPDLLARANNTLREFVPRGHCTCDEDIIRRLWLPVDIDPVRPAGTCATSQEHCAAVALQGRIVDSDFMAALGFTSPWEMDSGNGAYLLYPVDLPNDEASRDLVRDCLVVLAATFDTPRARVDVATYNASRILRVPGTKNRKGEQTTARFHRRALLTHVPKVQL